MTPRDACQRAVALLEANPERRGDLIDLLMEATDHSYGPLWHDVRLAVHNALVARYEPARVWVSADLWASLPARTHEEVVAVLTDAARSFDGLSVGDGLQRYGESVGVERRERATLSAPQDRSAAATANADLTYAGSPHNDSDGDALQREVDRADAHRAVTDIGWLHEDSPDEWRISRIDPWEAGDHDDRYPPAAKRDGR